MTKQPDETQPTRQAIRAQIDENLKRVYNSALTEEIPDRFRELLDQLKARETAEQGGGK